MRPLLPSPALPRPPRLALLALAFASLIWVINWTGNGSRVSDQVGASVASIWGGASPVAVETRRQRGRTCVVVRTAAVHTPLNLFALAASLISAAQEANSPIRIVFVDTDPKTPFVLLPSIVAKLRLIFSSSELFTFEAVIELSPLNFSHVKERYPNFELQDDAGYTLTDMVLNNLLNNNTKPEEDPCHYVLFTNGDNLYHRNFFRALMEQIEAKSAEMAACHFVSHYDWSEDFRKLLANFNCGVKEPGLFQVCYAKFQRLCMDLGAAVFTASLLQRTKERFIVRELEAGKLAPIWHHDRDGYLFDRLQGMNISGVVVNRALFIHQ